MSRACVIATLFLAVACAATSSTPPPRLALDPFYSKYVAADGIPIVASRRVPDAALFAARDMMRGMLAHRPDLAEVLVREGYRVAIIARDEALLDLPENRNWTKPGRDDPRLTRCERKHYDTRIGALSDRQYWDTRARGIGGRHMVGSEEDLLGLPVTRYWGETIFVHEFAHQVLDAIRLGDPSLYARVAAAYERAEEEGRFRDEYTMTTVDEYWAEGTQFWFNSNRLQVFDGRRILGHEDLATYDPRLYAALGDVYGASHRLKSDPFWNHPGRVPPGPPPMNTAEVC